MNYKTIKCDDCADIHLQVDQNEKGEILCPYCGETHTHGRGDGHRLSHCDRSICHAEVEIDGHTFTAKDGYYLKYSI